MRKSALYLIPVILFCAIVFVASIFEEPQAQQSVTAQGSSEEARHNNHVVKFSHSDANGATASERILVDKFQTAGILVWQPTSESTDGPIGNISGTTGSLVVQKTNILDATPIHFSDGMVREATSTAFNTFTDSMDHYGVYEVDLSDARWIRVEERASDSGTVDEITAEVHIQLKNQVEP